MRQTRRRPQSIMEIYGQGLQRSMAQFWSQDFKDFYLKVVLVSPLQEGRCQPPSHGRRMTEGSVPLWPPCLKKNAGPRRRWRDPAFSAAFIGHRKAEPLRLPSPALPGGSTASRPSRSGTRPFETDRPRGAARSSAVRRFASRSWTPYSWKAPDSAAFD